MYYKLTKSSNRRTNFKNSIFFTSMPANIIFYMILVKIRDLSKIPPHDGHARDLNPLKLSYDGQLAHLNEFIFPGAGKMILFSYAYHFSNPTKPLILLKFCKLRKHEGQLAHLNEFIFPRAGKMILFSYAYDSAKLPVHLHFKSW